MNLTTSQRRFQHIRRIHRPGSGTSANNRMNLIDKTKIIESSCVASVTMRFHFVLQNSPTEFRFQRSLFVRSNDKNPLILKNSWHIAFGDPFVQRPSTIAVFTNPLDHRSDMDYSLSFCKGSASDVPSHFSRPIIGSSFPKHGFLCQICTILKQHIFSRSIFHITAIRDCFIIFILRTSEINSCSN